jgi:hypothetical protein
MTRRLARWWRAFKLRSLRKFGRFIWWATSAGFFFWVLMMFLFLFLPSYRRLITIQDWLNYQIGFNGPMWVGGLFFCGLGFLISLLIDTVVALSHSRQIKTALFQALNHQSYSDSLQPVLDEAMIPGPPTQASSEYVALRRWISKHIMHDLAPDEPVTAPDEAAIWRRIVMRIYRASAFIGLFATSLYTMQGFIDGWRRWPYEQPFFSALRAALSHATIGLLICGLFLLIYTLITWGDHARKESRERVSLLYELTGSTATSSTRDTHQYQDTLGLHSLEEEQFQAVSSSYRE